MATQAMFRIWRGGPSGGSFADYKTPVDEGMVVLDVIHRIQAEQAPDLAVRWNCKAGKCGSCSAEINGMPKLMCMTRVSELNLDMPVIVEPMHAFPPIRDLVTDVSWNFRVKKTIKPFKPRKPDAAGRHMAHAAGGRRSRSGIPEMHRVLPVPGRLPRAARASQARRVYRPSFFGLCGCSADAPAGYGRPHPGSQGQAQHGLLQHHHMLPPGLSRSPLQSRRMRSSR